MIRKKRGEIEWLEFELLQGHPTIAHAVFLRSGEFDLKQENNQERALALLSLSRGVQVEQVHQEQLLHVEQKTLSRWQKAGSFDGLLTQEREVGLLIRHADCQAAIFFDPVRQAIANIHCGWRGSVRNIYKKTVHTMGALFRSKPADLIVCISPSLGPRAAQFLSYREELPPHFYPFQQKEYYFDFWKISQLQLQEEGVQQIEIACFCSQEGEKDFFSHRRGDRGRNGTLVALSNSC